MRQIVELNNVEKSYRRGGELIRVLGGISVEVPRGQFLALMGPSGSGKSTLLNLLGGLDKPDQGSVNIAGEDITRLGSDALATWRARHVGFVFQSFNLIPVLTALENVELPLSLTSLSRSERRERAEFALELVGIADRASHRPGQLSGGQEQRVAIARAVVTDPLFVLADEPTGDLDHGTTMAILDLLVQLNEQQQKTIMMVTHDPIAAEHASRRLHLDEGRLRELEESPP